VFTEYLRYLVLRLVNAVFGTLVNASRVWLIHKPYLLNKHIWVSIAWLCFQFYLRYFFSCRTTKNWSEISADGYFEEKHVLNNNIKIIIVFMGLFVNGNYKKCMLLHSHTFWIYRVYFFSIFHTVVSFMYYLKTLTNVKVIYLTWNFGVILLIGEKQKYSKRNLSYRHFFVCKCHMDPSGTERGSPRWETGN
jgi:hypothetical protein